jgi:hypothetical protein
LEWYKATFTTTHLLRIPEPQPIPFTTARFSSLICCAMVSLEPDWNWAASLCVV